MRARRSPWLVAAAAWALRGVDSGEAACGKVFIYDLPSALYDLRWRPSPTPGATPRERLAPFASVEEVFGSEHVEKSRSCEGLDDHAFESLYATEQWGAAEQLLYRAATSGRCPRTLDPSEADIFLVPVLPKAKSGGGWVGACNATGADERSLVKALPHLNERTAHRHGTRRAARPRSTREASSRSRRGPRRCPRRRYYKRRAPRRGGP